MILKARNTRAPKRLAGFPNASNTGVPLGAPGDPRPAEALTPATPTSAGRINIQSRQDIDHVDFSGLAVVPTAAASGTTFRKCLFRQPTAMGAPWLIQLTNGSFNGLLFEDCTFDGATADPWFPVGMPLSMSASSTGLTIRRCNMTGTNDIFDFGPWDGVLIEDSYLHHPIVDKHTDTSPDHSNSAVWGHADATQFQSSVANVTVRNCTLIANPIGGAGGNAILQVGQLAAGGFVTNVRYENNLFSGGAYSFNANLTNAITVNGYFEVVNNRFVPDMVFGPFTASFKTLATALSGNVWHQDGTTPYGLTVTRNQPVVP